MKEAVCDLYTRYLCSQHASYWLSVLHSYCYYELISFFCTRRFNKYVESETFWCTGGRKVFAFLSCLKFNFVQRQQ